MFFQQTVDALVRESRALMDSTKTLFGAAAGVLVNRPVWAYVALSAARYALDSVDQALAIEGPAALEMVNDPWNAVWDIQLREAPANPLLAGFDIFVVAPAMTMSFKPSYRIVGRVVNTFLFVGGPLLGVRFYNPMLSVVRLWCAGALLVRLASRVLNFTTSSPADHPPAPRGARRA